MSKGMKNNTFIAGRNNPIAGRNESRQREIRRTRSLRAAINSLRAAMNGGRGDLQRLGILEFVAGRNSPIPGRNGVLKNAVLGIT
jgi:hypothetical protein